jgi:hypothetical protein
MCSEQELEWDIAISKRRFDCQAKRGGEQCEREKQFPPRFFGYTFFGRCQKGVFSVTEKQLMGELVTDCPRCGATKITFDVKSQHYIYREYDWQNWYEVFGICRHCERSTVFVLSLKRPEMARYVESNGLVKAGDSVNNYMNVEGFINLKSTVKAKPPEHVPKNIAAAFGEGATCLAVECYNAAGTMFRLCIDLATLPLLPEKDENGLNGRIRRNLGLRLPWLFDKSLLPSALRELSSCVKEDGNDGAHAGTLTKEDAEDLLEFAYAFLERIYTEPERLRLAKERRDNRRKPKP